MAARRPTIPPARPVINLEDWEAKAPLGDPENRSVNLVKTASEYTSLPFKVRTSAQSNNLVERDQRVAVRACARQRLYEIGVQDLGA